jgi:pyruvate formate lyase activating enzyme
MREAELYEKQPDNVVKCRTCQWRCRINAGKLGACGMYENKGGVLYNLNYGYASSLNTDPIEKKPLFHFYPGTLCFSMGTLGCNFRCKHCQNWEISTPDAGSIAAMCREVKPEAAIKMAVQSGSRGIAWTYNEPAVWFEYTLECAKLAKKAGLYTVYVTNGFATPEALDTIGPYLDAWRVDIKGFTDKFYKEIAGVPHWREILDITKRAKEKWNMHVEVVSNLIPTLNDDDRELTALASWIKTELGELTPWHVTRFYPQHELNHLPPTPVETLEKAVEIGKKAGLKFIYAGNIPGHASESTICYQCHNVIVQRSGYNTKVIGLNGSHCRFCGSDLNFRPAETKESTHDN